MYVVRSAPVAAQWITLFRFNDLVPYLVASPMMPEDMTNDGIGSNHDPA